MAFQGFTLPSPNGGLNLVDAIDDMAPNEALELVNIFPTGLGAQVRNGYASFASTGASSQLNFLRGLPLADATYKTVGGDSNKIWSFASGSATDITGTTTPTSSNWNTDVFAHRLYMANGVDTVQVYDGTTVADSTFSGVTLANLINVSSFKERIYFIEKGTLKTWYGGSQVTGGAALTAFDLKYAMKLGGYLLFAGSWTNQLASTSADLFFAVSSEGEIVFYNGTSPADSTTPWGLVARYVIGKPLGYRSFIRVNNDVWILTEQGIVPISALFTNDPEGALNTIGRNINPLIAQYAKSIGFSHLWHGVFWPQGRRVFVVIPTGGSSTILAVYGLDAKGWTTYQLYSAGDAVSLDVVNGTPYYASSDGHVYTGETGYNDKNNAIAFNGRFSFSFFGQRGLYKAFKDIRPLMRTLRGLQLGLGIDTNFQRGVDVDTITTASGTFTPWGSPWGSPWSSDIAYIYDRYALRGQGHSAAIRIRGSVKDAPLELYGFEVRFDAGGQV